MMLGPIDSDPVDDTITLGDSRHASHLLAQAHYGI
jgi:hypothetical protein